MGDSWLAVGLRSSVESHLVSVGLSPQVNLGTNLGRFSVLQGQQSGWLDRTKLRFGFKNSLVTRS